MGCDIHMYVEYSPRKFAHQRAKYGWISYGQRINPGRDYDLFGLLADVRGGTAIYPKRGMPADAGFYTQYDNKIYISETSAEYGERSMATAQAEEQVAKWGATMEYATDGRPLSVTNTDWHSHSWLNRNEFEHVLSARALTEGGRAAIEYYALLASMRALEDDGLNESRVVFWFDC